jgi:hypothetical protein
VTDLSLNWAPAGSTGWQANRGGFTYHAAHREGADGAKGLITRDGKRIRLVATDLDEVMASCEGHANLIGGAK